MILGVSSESAGPATFFEAFAFAHRARCAAAIPLRALADVVRFLVIVTTLLWRRFVCRSLPSPWPAHRAL